MPVTCLFILCLFCPWTLSLQVRRDVNKVITTFAGFTFKPHYSPSRLQGSNIIPKTTGLKSSSSAYYWPNNWTVLSNISHLFSVTVAPESQMRWEELWTGEEHPAWQAQVILGDVTEQNLFQPVILFTYNSADTIALDSSSLLEIKMAEVKHEILHYFKKSA